MIPDPQEGPGGLEAMEGDKGIDPFCSTSLPHEMEGILIEMLQRLGFVTSPCGPDNRRVGECTNV